MKRMVLLCVVLFMMGCMTEAEEREFIKQNELEKAEKQKFNTVCKHRPSKLSCDEILECYSLCDIGTSSYSAENACYRSWDPYLWKCFGYNSNGPQRQNTSN